MVCASAFQPSSVGLGCRVIPALGGFAQQFQPWRVSVSLSDCRLPLLQKRKQSVPDPPKYCLRLPGERPPSLRVAPTEQGTKGRQHTCFAKIASLSSDFSARTRRADPHRTEPFSPGLSLANQHELERERQQRIQDAHRMAPYRLLEQAGRLGPAPRRKVLTWRSKANCAIATILPRKPI